MKIALTIIVLIVGTIVACGSVSAFSDLADRPTADQLLQQIQDGTE